MIDDVDTCSLAHGLGSRLLPVLGGELTIEVSSRGWTGSLLARRLGLATPPNSTTSGSLRIEPAEAGERWIREFGAHTWMSTLTPGDRDTVVERAGCSTLRFGVSLDSQWNTHMMLRSMSIGGIRVPIRRWFGIEACIAPNATTRVTIRVPGGSCSYIARFVGAERPTREVAP